MAKQRTIPAALECAKWMPELRHSTGEAFDITQSEVVQWLVRQSEVLQFLFETVRRHGSKTKLIVYSPERGTWRGVDYEPH